MRSYLYSTILRHGSWFLLVAIGIFTFFPNLFLGKAFYGEEQSGFYYLISYYVSKSVTIGTPMTWISNYFGGVPASLDQFASAWYPLNRALFSFFDFFTAHHLSMTTALIAGLLLTYWFGRRQEWQRSSSAMLALMYLSATTYAWLLIGTTAAHSFAILPGLLVALHYAAYTKRFVAAILGGSVALGVGFLAGFMQIVFYDYVIAGLYALFLDWVRYDRALPFYKNLYVSYVYSAITILGLCIGFLQFFPSAYLIDLTIRTNTYAIQNAIIPYPTEFIAFFLPPYLSVPFLGGGGSAGFYITAIGFMAAILGLLYYRTREILFFGGVYALMAAFAFHIPPFGWINEYIPPFSRMGGNFRWMVGAAFPIAFLGAAGLEALLRNPDRISLKARRITIIGMTIVSAGLLIGSLAISILASYAGSSPDIMSSLLSWYTSGRALSFPAAHYLSVLTQALHDVENAFSLLSPRYAFGALLWPIATLIFYILFFKQDLRPYIPSAALFFASVTVVGTIALQWNELVPQTLYFEEPPLARVIKGREEGNVPYRIMGYIIGDGAFLQMQGKPKPTPEEITSIQFQQLSNNINLYFGIDRMDGMEPYRTLRHNRLLNTVIAHDWAAWAFDDASAEIATSPLDQLYNRNVQKKVTLDEKLADLPKRLPLLSMMNVKYLYTPFKVSAPSLIRVADVPVTTGTSTAITLHLYENTRVLPRIHVVHKPRFAANERDAFLAAVSETDFAKRTIIECASCSDAVPGKASIDIKEYAHGRIIFDVDASVDSWIVISESAFPGWRATVDDVETPIYIANYLFQAIRVPKGAHHVTLKYEDVALQLLLRQP